ncbi:MAG: NUDIX domain-containing protein, partial [Planctomycetota bacterium]
PAGIGASRNATIEIEQAVAAKAIIRRTGRVLLLKRADKEISGGQWDLPGGRIEPGEAVFDGLRREVREETGLRLVSAFARAAWDFMPRPDFQFVVIGHAAEVANGDVMLSREHDEYAWVDPARPTITIPDWIADAIAACG